MTEIWKGIPGWDQYEASTLGRIKRIEGRTSNGRSRVRERILKPAAPQGYAKVVLNQGRAVTFKVDVLVLMTFVGPRPPGMESCHEDDDKLNNKLSNLRWDTHYANGQDALRNGLMQIGEQCHKAKLTEDDVRQIRREYRLGTTMRASAVWLARKYGISRGMVVDIVNRRYWKHVE